MKTKKKKEAKRSFSVNHKKQASNDEPSLGVSLVVCVCVCESIQQTTDRQKERSHTRRGERERFKDSPVEKAMGSQTMTLQQLAVSMIKWLLLLVVLQLVYGEETIGGQSSPLGVDTTGTVDTETVSTVLPKESSCPGTSSRYQQQSVSSCGLGHDSESDLLQCTETCEDNENDTDGVCCSTPHGGHVPADQSCEPEYGPSVRDPIGRNVSSVLL